MIDSVFNRRPVDSGDFLPFSKAFRFAVVSHQEICASIVRLLSLRRPATVPGLIMAVIVDAIYFVAFGWARPHVLQKRLKRKLPAITYLNSASTVTWIGLVVFIQTPPLYSAPNLVFCRVGLPVRAAMADCVPGAFATGCVATHETCSPHFNFVPAVAAAKPLAAFDEPYCSETAKPLAGEIVFWRMVSSHEKVLSQEGCLWSEPSWRNSAMHGSFYYRTATEAVQ